MMLYACFLAQKAESCNHFPLSILISEQWIMYFYGYAYSMKGLLGKEKFDVEVKENKIMFVNRFDLNYFKGVSKNELFSDDVLTDEMRKRLRTIEQYFEENKPNSDV